jgi:hypothetical protein
MKQRLAGFRAFLLRNSRLALPSCWLQLTLGGGCAPALNVHRELRAEIVFAGELPKQEAR